ncbi:MAG TPA: hypothetical protein VG733_02100, partial [Chthoniobacteraceae bacterium]|nr:hypothetical protein [Chthoniobacteraceae bacterium]
HSSSGDVRIEETGPEAGPGAILSQRGDYSKLKACSGWEPRISLERSLADLLDEWRAKVRREA